MIELEHSPLGGSGAKRFLNCSFSFLEHRRQLAAGTFFNAPSEFAERGTGAHELGALCLQDGSEPYEHIGEEFNGYLTGWPDGIEMDAVSIYVAECRKILETRGGPSKIYIETTIRLPDLHPLLKGTVDFAFLTQYGLWLRDYKNGEGVGVPAPNNDQLLYYAFLLAMSMAGIQGYSRDFPISLGIIQPNFYGHFEAPEIWETTLGYVLDWGHNVLLPRMNALLAAEMDAEDEPNPGDWCQFCPVLLDCPKMQKAYQEYSEASEDFVVMLTDAELDYYYSQRSNVARFKTVMEQTVYARKVGGGSIPSAKLVEKKTARVWKPGAQEALKASLGAAALTTPEIKSPAAIEKLSTRGKELALEWAYKPEADRLTVAPLSDPRAEAKPRTNADVFAQHQQTPEQAGW